MRVSIVICTYNRFELLQENIFNIINNVDGSCEAEVLIIDNNSTDKTYERIKKCIIENDFNNIKVFQEIRQGLSFARNHGLELSTGDIVVYLDDDAFPSKGWLKTIISRFEKDGVRVLGGEVLPKYEIDRPEWLGNPILGLYSVMELEKGFYPLASPLHPLGANMAFDRRIIEKILFPIELGRKGDSLMSGEESYVFSEIRKSGVDIYYDSDMSVKHFISKQRLTKDWIISRHKFEGKTKKQLSSTGKFASLKVFTVSAIKVVFFSCCAILSKKNRFSYYCKVISALNTIK